MRRRARPIEPFLWLLFSAGGVLAALFLPVVVLLFGVVYPLGGIGPPTYPGLHALAAHALTRVVIFIVCVLSLIHWAHRFRFTVLHGLRISRLGRLVSVFCYGGALVGSLATLVVLVRI
ncbi:MAG: fumarate reductase subunit [Pseudonocardiales bacterium]|nr:fumarate reductase subunit [Pseudonocardiales bacterium]